MSNNIFNAVLFSSGAIIGAAVIKVLFSNKKNINTDDIICDCYCKTCGRLCGTHALPQNYTADTAVVNYAEIGKSMMDLNCINIQLVRRRPTTSVENLNPDDTNQPNQNDTNQPNRTTTLHTDQFIVKLEQYVEELNDGHENKTNNDENKAYDANETNNDTNGANKTNNDEKNKQLQSLITDDITEGLNAEEIAEVVLLASKHLVSSPDCQLTS